MTLTLVRESCSDEGARDRVVRMTAPKNLIHRTYEPFRFLSRLTLIPLSVQPRTRLVSLTVTHEADPPWRWAPTLVVRLGPLRRALGIGWWLDSAVSSLQEEFQQRVAHEEIKAAYDRYVAVNGDISYDAWFEARETVLQNGRDPEDPMEILLAVNS